MSIRKPSDFRLSRRGWVVLAVFALLVSSYMADSVASVGRVRSGVRAGSLELGGKNEDEARALLTKRAALLVSQPAELFAELQRFSIEPSEISFTPDVEATVDEAMGIGRRGNVFVRLWQRLRALFAATDVGWSSDFDRDATTALITTWSDTIDTEGREAGITLRGDTIVPVSAVPGRKLDRKTAVGVVVDGLSTWPRHSVELPIAVHSRRTDIDDARRAAEQANRWARASVAVVAPDGSRKTLSRIQVASMLEAVPKKSAGEWELEVRFNVDRVGEELEEAMKPYEREARSATFAVNEASVSVIAGQDGRTFDPVKTARELAVAARRDQPRSAQAAFKSVEPEMTTDEAKDLKITELVSTFTTQHPCCAARVKNIHRMADVVDGAIVRPGESFSLNDYAGERTVEKGYLLAPMIFDGEFKDSVGGGVSQFATTMFNAIFFGGYKIDAHRPHSYYISRYPPGREATVSWPHPDLKFTNNSSAGVLIKTAYSGTSITVSFYGDKEGKVVTAEAGPRTNPTTFTTQYKENPAVPPGQEHVVQPGEGGFDIVVTRVINQNGKERRERFFTRYKPEPRIIEVAPGGQPCPSPEAGQSPEPCPSASPGPDDREPRRTPEPAETPEATEEP